MQKLILIVLSIISLAEVVNGQTNKQIKESEIRLRQELTQLRQTFFDAQKQGNRALLEQLLADDFYFVHSTGVLTKRKEFIDRLVEQAGRQRDIEFTEQELLIYGHNTAVWLTRSIGRAADGTETNFRATDVLVKNESQWQWVAVNSTRLSTRPKPIPVSNDTIKSYLGKYQIGPDKILVITEEDGKLIGQSNSVRQRELIATSATEFIWFSPDSNVDMRIAFSRDKDSHILNAILKTEGREIWRAKKID